MRNSTKRTLTTLFALSLLTLAGSSAQEIRFLWSETHNEVLAEHNAAIYTPVAKPANWVDFEFDRIEAQTTLQAVYPYPAEEDEIIQAIEVVPSDTELAETPESMTIEGRVVEFPEEW